MDRKNLLKAGRRNSLNVSSRSLNASRILTDSSNYVLENYGTSLPVAVIELISSSGKSDCSVSLSKDGWAWFVSGRQLVIWKYSKAGQTNQAANTTLGRKSAAVASPKAYELMLPASELAHKADLVAVFSTEPENVPSCIAVSPEGTVRYWDSVAHESFFVELNIDLQGQECDLLVEAMPLGCLVATTTASILLLTPRMSDGRPTVLCRSFKTPQGLLGSISRRMSSLFFGSASSHQSMDARLVKVLCQKRDANNLDVQVLCNQSLQFWQVSDTERLVHQCDVDKWVREALVTHLWSRSDSSVIDSLKVWILDAQVQKSDLFMLVAASNPSVGSQIQYAFASVPLRAAQSPPAGFSTFSVLKFATPAPERGDDPPHCRFVIVNSIGYLYADKWILCVPATEPLEEPDRLDVRSASERFIGAGLYNQKPVFFSSRHGVLVLQPTSGVGVGMNDSQSVFDESVLDHSQVMTDTANLDPAQAESASSKLKMAFFNFCKKNIYDAQALLEDLFSSPSSKGHADSLMDRLVVELSEKIVDDYPASDPRWTDSVPAGHESTFTTVSLLVLHQIEDKVKAHDLFMTFLRNMSMWSELTSVSERRGAKSSAFSLMEHAEKLRSALALRALHTPGSTLIDTAIRRVLNERSVELTNDKLTQQDLFYRHVSALNDFYPCLVDVLSETASAGSNPSDKVKHIVNVANVAIAMTNAARDYRARNIELLEQCEHNTELLPWIAAPGPRSVRSSIIRLLHLTVDEGVANADDAGVRSGLWGQASNLADLLLDSLKLYADSCEDNLSLHAQVKQDVLTERSSILDLFLKGREFERASVLAEKYVDFGALLAICDETLNEDKLSVYIDKLGEAGFTEFACRWYMQRNQREKLLRLRRPEVSAFLENHPDILWVDQSESEHYLDASRTLINLATAEKELFSRKKMLLSLAKLHLVTEEKLGPDPELVQSELDAVESELTLLMHQEQLPASVLHAYDLDPATMRVLTATEMIEMYICDENVLANELDFKKALELLEYADDEAEDRDARRLRIWAKAILRDAWTTFDTDNVLPSISGTVFFKIIEFSLSTGEDLADVLPNPEEILQEPLLADLASNDVFQFLLKAVYEHVRSLMDVAR